MPRSYLPTLLALKLPEMFVALAVGGVVGALIGAFRGGNAPNRRAVLLLVALAAALPVAVAVAMRPAMYNGVRHFLFVVPPLAVAGGLAGAWLFERAAPPRSSGGDGRGGRLRRRARVAGRRHGAACILTNTRRSTGSPAASPARASATCSTIGGSSLKQASQGLAAKIAELKLQKPKDRRWKLAVCGHHRSPQVELGPDFETTWDPKGADFAMMLGEFYCRQFDAPVLVEVDARRRRLCARLRHPRPLLRHAAHATRTDGKIKIRRPAVSRTAERSKAKLPSAFSSAPWPRLLTA